MMREYVVKVTDALVPDAFQRFENEWSPEQELVRCKDCKHWMANTQFCGLLTVDGFTAHRTPPEWFCADGKGK